MMRLRLVAQGALALCLLACPALAGMLPGKYEISSSMTTGGNTKKTETYCLTAAEIDEIKASLDKGLDLAADKNECTVRDISENSGHYVSDYTCKNDRSGERHMEAVMTDGQLDISDTAPLKFEGEIIKFGYLVSFKRIGDCN